MTSQNQKHKKYQEEEEERVNIEVISGPPSHITFFVHSGRDFCCCSSSQQNGNVSKQAESYLSTTQLHDQQIHDFLRCLTLLAPQSGAHRRGAFTDPIHI